MGLRLQEVHIPDVQQPHQQGHVVLRGGGAEVLVHRVEAGQQLLEDVRAQHGGQHGADRGIHAVAAADPVPEAEGVLRVDAEGLHLVQRGGDGDEVLRHGLRLLLDRETGVLAQPGQQPLAHQARVGEGLERGEGLRRDDHQRGLGIEVAGGLVRIGGVDVGEEPGGQPVLREGLQRLVDHDRSEVAAADADVHDSLDLLPGHAGPLTGAHRVREVVDALQRLVDVRVDLLAVDLERRRGALGATERGVEHRAVLGGVEVGTGEHGVSALLDADLAGELLEQLHGLGGDQVLREVDAEIRSGTAEALGTLRIGIEPLAQGAGDLEVVRLEGGPGVRGRGIEGSGGRVRSSHTAIEHPSGEERRARSACCTCSRRSG